MKALLIVFGSVAAIAGAVTDLPPTSPVFCADFFSSGCDFGDHKLQGPGGGYDGAEAHGDCRTCVGEFPCHSSCFALTSLDPDVQSSYMAALAAAASGDVESVMALIDSAAPFVIVNDERHAVQVMSCTGTEVIASLPLHSLANGALIE